MSGAGHNTVDWDRLASAYPRQALLERSSLGTALDLLDPGPDERLLDIGTGTAELLRSLSKRSGRPAEAIGIDPCARMLAQAGPLPAGWQLAQGRGEQLPFDSASFDLVTISYVLHVVDADTRRSLISEAARVLRPGGSIATVTIAPPVSRAAKAITAPVRWAAQRYPSLFVGLQPLDPAADLERGGFSESGRRRDFRGYPALCLVAIRSQ